VVLFVADAVIDDRAAEDLTYRSCGARGLDGDLLDDARIGDCRGSLAARRSTSRSVVGISAGGVAS